MTKTFFNYSLLFSYLHLIIIYYLHILYTSAFNYYSLFTAYLHSTYIIIYILSYNIHIYYLFTFIIIFFFRLIVAADRLPPISLWGGGMLRTAAQATSLYIYMV